MTRRLACPAGVSQTEASSRERKVAVKEARHIFLKSSFSGSGQARTTAFARVCHRTRRLMPATPQPNVPAHAKVIILGSGPAGYTAAIYAARAMLEPVLIAGFEPGGQLMITTDVENYPGFAAPIQGPWLMEQMKAQAEHVGTRMIADQIVEVKLRQHPFLLTGDSGKTYSCDTLVIATGAKAQWLGLPSEERVKGYGVSA